MKRFWLLPLLLVCFIFWTSPLTAQDRVTFRIPLPLSGSYAKFADIERKAYEIAVEEINAAHGIQGKAISLEFQDSRGISELSKLIAEKLIDQYKQPLIFGEYSSNCSKAMAAVAEAMKRALELSKKYVEQRRATFSATCLTKLGVSKLPYFG